MQLNLRLIISLLVIAALTAGCKENYRHYEYARIIDEIRKPTIEKAERYLDEEPETVTMAYCGRSAGGRHDFYSEGDYWWPDPDNPGGSYIRRDGLSNPEVFSEHRHAMVRLSDITATLTSAWLLTGDQRFADKALEHLNAWFVDTETMMNPHMLYAQAISGIVTGRGIGLIDAYHLVEVAQSVRVLSGRKMIPGDQEKRIMEWFSRFLSWMTTHEYGIDEMNTTNNHAVCWLATAGVMARLTSNREVADFCIDRFRNILLPGQMAPDGSFPREMERTKPYGYALFNMDAYANAAWILSTPEDNLWEFETPDGRSLKLGMEFIGDPQPAGAPSLDLDGS